MVYRSEEVGKRLQQLRKSHGYSREKIAEAIGRSPKYYGDIERGTCGMSLETLIGLADFFHVSLDYLVDGMEENETEQMDAQTKWIVKTVCNLDEPMKRTILDMVTLVVGQAEHEE